MPTLTPTGQRLVQDLAQRHGFSEDAVTEMLGAITAGQGRMAQFSHTEFGGNGQWMSGGMLMLGDMFNNGLKNRVNGLCTDLADALVSSGPLVGVAQSQSQSQNGGGAPAHLPDTPFFTPSPESSWWPRELGTPSSSGSQNAMRYAWFADAHRLALERHGEVTLYDTLDHRIGGFSQQQGSAENLSMSSQHGTIDLASLPIVSDDEPAAETVSNDSESEPSAESASAQTPQVHRSEHAASNRETDPGNDPAKAPSGEAAPASQGDPVQLIERLGELRDRGLLTDEEFAAKKSELLARL